MIGRSSTLAVVLGSGAVHYFPSMPRMETWLAVVLGAAFVSCVFVGVCHCFGLNRQLGRCILISSWACIVGLLITAARVEHRLADELISDNENKVTRVVLQVASLVKVSPDSRQFEAQVISSMPTGVPSRIYVSWSAAGRTGPYGRFAEQPADFPDLVPGQIWRMALTLKKPHGNLNPHGFDYESYMFANGLRATGSVRGKPLYYGDEPWTSLPIVAQRTRHYVRKAMWPYVKDKRYGAVLLALAIGDQASVNAGDWEVFNRTGITHLVSISGSHITMIAAIGGLITLWLWRRWCVGGRAMADRIPAQIAAALVALVIAWLYCLLAGWGVPARRTFLMLFIVAASHVLRLPLNTSRLLCLVAFAVVILDPWALLASGFWLSFGAVYVLMASAGWWGLSFSRHLATRRQRTWRFVRQASGLQLAITVGLMPFLALMFHQVSVASPLANAYAIPVISLVVTPLSLVLAAIAFIPGLEWLAQSVAWLSHIALYLIMQPTVWLAQLNIANFDVAAAPLWITLVALLGLLLAIMPYGLPMRSAAWLLILPALFWRPDRPAHGEWDLIALDVGQAGAIIIQTSRHALVFDTGLRSSPTSDGGSRIVWPFLRSNGVKKLDVLVLSHADIDHAGGVRSLLESTSVQQSYSSFDLYEHLSREARLLGVPKSLPKLPLAMSACEYGVMWRIDGVTFEFLWPVKQAELVRSVKLRQPNNHACVLSIRGQDHAALLTADIGAVQEKSLVARGLEPVDVVVAAHHGSKNSSSDEFVRSVRAQHVLAQVGIWNHYGHPNPHIQQRWENAGAKFWRTDLQGAVIARSRVGSLQVQSLRETHARYWHAR